jgi:hypothetical protein
MDMDEGDKQFDNISPCSHTLVLAIGHRRPLGILLILRILQLKGNVMASSAGDEAL